MAKKIPVGDPRRFLQSACKKNNLKRMTDADFNKNQNFLGGLDKLSNLEIDSGITSGLGIIAATGRAGGAPLEKLINSGANGVMNTVFSKDKDGNGLDLGGAANVNKIMGAVNPANFNNAVSSSNQIIEKLKTNDFNPKDIPTFTRDFVATAKSFRGAFKLGPQSSDKHVNIECHPSPYAADLISRGVKYKFLYVVEFKFNEPYSSSIGSLDHAFMVKQCQLPTTRFEYEDINMYNFRTRVAKKTEFEPITMNFYDDNTNQVIQFYNAYAKTMSPITNRTGAETDRYETESLDFNQEVTIRTDSGSHTGYKNSSSLGPLRLDNEQDKTIIKSINIYHIFSYGALMNVYQLYNPKILEMQIGELDSSSSEYTDMNLQVAYDSYNILSNISTNGGESKYDLEKISSGTTRNFTAQYPIINSADVLHPNAQDAIGQSIGPELKTKTKTIEEDPPKGFLEQAKDAFKETFNI